MSVYDNNIFSEVADDLDLDENDLRRTFSMWLATIGSGDKARAEPNLEYACYAVYRLAQLKTALRMSQRSRNEWKERAVSLGSPGHLMETDA